MREQIPIIKQPDVEETPELKEAVDAEQLAFEYKFKKEQMLSVLDEVKKNMDYDSIISSDFFKNLPDNREIINFIKNKTDVRDEARDKISKLVDKIIQLEEDLKKTNEDDERKKIEDEIGLIVKDKNDEVGKYNSDFGNFDSDLKQELASKDLSDKEIDDYLLRASIEKHSSADYDVLSEDILSILKYDSEAIEDVLLACIENKEKKKLEVNRNEDTENKKQAEHLEQRIS